MADDSKSPLVRNETTVPVDKEDTLEYFLEVSPQFKLGNLVTEASHPDTDRLSKLVKKDVPAAFRLLQKVDVAALEVLETKAAGVAELAKAINEVLTAGHKVFISGCGATGRLALSLEKFALEGLIAEEEYRDKVKGFMAGGDAALIRSIEKFEDRPEYGARQLKELGFANGDLLIAITEGGETPFVIATAEEALKIGSSVKPFFLYCNPDEVLVEVAERSKRILTNENVRKLNLTVGPMAITGSTRMQATTVQLAAAGLALRHHAAPENIKADLELLCRVVGNLRYDSLAPLTQAEAHLYRSEEYFLYESDDFSMTVMTDTTERAPTFSLPPFENINRPEDAASQTYLVIPSAANLRDAWHKLLGRAWRPLEWAETKDKTGAEALQGYDFSRDTAKRRVQSHPDKASHRLTVKKVDGGVRFLLRSLPAFYRPLVRPTTVASVAVSFGLSLTPDISKHFNDDILLTNIALKVLLNAHSTLIMGLLGRYDGNVMTHVKPSNFKLIDRAARYVTMVLKNSGKFSYETEKDPEPEPEPQPEPEPEQKSGEDSQPAPQAEEQPKAEENGTAHEEPREEAPRATSSVPLLPSYRNIVKRIFYFRAKQRADEPIVLKVADYFLHPDEYPPTPPPEPAHEPAQQEQGEAHPAEGEAAQPQADNSAPNDPQNTEAPPEPTQAPATA